MDKMQNTKMCFEGTSFVQKIKGEEQFASSIFPRRVFFPKLLSKESRRRRV